MFAAAAENIVRAFFKQPPECFFVGCLIFECHGSHSVFESFYSHGARATTEHFFKRFLQLWLNIQVAPQTLIDSPERAYLGIDFPRLNRGEVRLSNMRAFSEVSLCHSKTIAQDAYPVSRCAITSFGRSLNLEA